MKYVVILGLLTGIFVGLLQLRAGEIQLEGEAKSALINQFQGLDVTPEYARFVQIVVTTTDVQISMDQAKIHIFEGPKQ